MSAPCLCRRGGRGRHSFVFTRSTGMLSWLGFQVCTFVNSRTIFNPQAGASFSAQADSMVHVFRNGGRLADSQE